jgi:hypothetical protein
MLMKRQIKQLLLYTLVAILVTSVFVFWPKTVHHESSDIESKMPKAYSYKKTTASNGMELHYLQTRPSNISLERINNNVILAPYYGINGGFFYDSSLLSIAVVNDVPVNGESNAYGAGSENIKYARGTLVWDGLLDTLSVQVVRKATELQISDRTLYWAQGGISMGLGLDDRWADQAKVENAPFPDGAHLRSGAVYDTHGNLYLVVSSTKGTLGDFRKAILEEIGNGSLVDGVFLDGDGSSQLRSRETKLAGDNRTVVEMMRILR